MPAFTLYGSRGSTNTDRVRLTLAEGGFTDYELMPLNLLGGEHKVGAHSIERQYGFSSYEEIVDRITFESIDYSLNSPEHTKRHPWGKIPALTSANGFTLYESRAICKYLATKYSFPLLPAHTDIEGQALFDQAQSVEMLYFAEPAGRFAFEKFGKRLFGLPPDDAVVSDALRSVETFFDIADPLLRERDYMAGNDFSLVDIYYIPLIQRLLACGHGDIISSRTAVSAWWDRCMNRPGIQALLAADKEAALPAQK